MRTIAYVDGYNLYYGRLQGTPWKWLDIHALLQHILHVQAPAMTLTRVRYFTAPVIARLASHGHLSLEAQQTYLRALEATGVDVNLGRHQLEASEQGASASRVADAVGGLDPHCDPRRRARGSTTAAASADPPQAGGQTCVLVSRKA